MKQSVDALLDKIARLRRLIAKSFLEIEQLQCRATGIVGSRMYADFKLSSRQREIMTLLARGLSNKEISQELHLSVRGVKFHVSSLLVRYRKHTRQELGDIARAGDGRGK
jgi:DNA-binding NarL/FixJ family response regulator